VVPYTYAGTKRAQMTDASGTTANYTYDALNRLATVQENNTGTTAYGYDNVGNLQSATYPNCVMHSYSYDTRNRLTTLGVANAAQPVAG